MFLKFDEIAEYIPNDNKYHDIQIVNDSIYIDGVCENAKRIFDSVRCFDRVLTDDEVTKLYNAVH